MIERIRGLFVIPQLRDRFLFTLAMILVVRLGTHITLPGVDVRALTQSFSGEGVLGFVDLFSGGALSRFSIFALGILPYINASIIMQLMMVVWPELKEMAQEGEGGRRQIAQYTRYGALGIAVIQGVVMSLGFRTYVNPQISLFWFVLYATVILAAGSAFVLWLSEIMTDRGLGNGASVLIFVGIIARMPFYISSTYKQIYGGTPIVAVLFFVLVLLAMIVGIVIVQEAERKIPVQYAKRIVGRKMYGGQSTYIPLRLIQGGVLPIIFASAVLQFPVMLSGILNFPSLSTFMSRFYSYNGLVYNLSFCFLIFFFSYFYTAISFNPAELADNIKKYGGFVVGVRLGKPTVEYLERIIARLTLVGATTLALIALVPIITANLTKVTAFVGLGGTALLIMVGVAMDLIKNIDAQLVAKRYEGILK